MNSDPLCLSIETSCDETSLCFFEKSESKPNFLDKVNSIKILSNIVSSQIDIHKNYGGVVPEISAREHAEQIHDLYTIIVKEGNIDISQLDYIFVTTEPGLKSALKVGIEFAKSLKFFVQKEYQKSVQLKFVNHLKGHVASCFYNCTQTSNSLTPNNQIFPHLHLLVSGGNTQLILLSNWQQWQILGQTLDDAVGETYDKIGRMLGLDYPSGATIGKIADISKDSSNQNLQNLPVSMLNSKNYNFSFSGLKTAVRYKIRDCKIQNVNLDQKLAESEIKELLCKQNFILSDNDQKTKLQFIKEICISSQYVINKQIKNKLDSAIKNYSPKSIGVSGGVSANIALRQMINRSSYKLDNSKLQNSSHTDSNLVFIPNLSLTGDNAVMIGLAGILDLD